MLATVCSHIALFASLICVASGATGTVTDPIAVNSTGCGQLSPISEIFPLASRTSLFFKLNISAHSCQTHSPNFLDVLMRRVNETGDPDLYVRACPTEAITVEGCNVTVARDSTTSAEHAATVPLLWSPGEGYKVYVFEVEAWGSHDTEFQIGAIDSTCPADITWSDAQGKLTAVECGGVHRGTCSAGGQCMCLEDPHVAGNRYVNDDCSGYQFANLTVNQAEASYRIQHYQPSYVSFNVSEDTYELQVDIFTISGAQVEPALFFGGPDGQYVYTTQSWSNSSTQIVLSVDPVGLRTDPLRQFGFWTLRMQYHNSSDPADAQKFSQVRVRVSENKCPSDCTGHGVCNPATHVCACTGSFGGAACSSPLTLAEPDQLRFDINGASTNIPGTGLAVPFSLTQEAAMTVKLNISWAPAGSTLVVNVTAIDRDQAAWCPSYPVVTVTKEPPRSSLAPQSFDCQNAPAESSIILCGSEFTDNLESGVGLWYATVYAAGFADLKFTMSARVEGSKTTAMYEKDLSDLHQCQAALGDCGGGSSGVSGGIAALLFFIGAFVGLAAGVLLVKFVLVPKGMGGFSALEPSTPSAPYTQSKGLSFTNNEGGQGLLGTGGSGGSVL